MTPVPSVDEHAAPSTMSLLEPTQPATGLPLPFPGSAKPFSTMDGGLPMPEVMVSLCHRDRRRQHGRGESTEERATSSIEAGHEDDSTLSYATMCAGDTVNCWDGEGAGARKHDHGKPD